MPVSVTKYVQIDRPVADTYAFLADPATMPKWAIHNVTSIKPVGNGRWEMDTPRGKGFLIPQYQKPNGILDHDFIDAGEGFWSVTARAVPIAESASVYMITLTKPDADAHGSIRGWHEADGRGTNRIESLRRSALTRVSISHQIRKEPLYVSQTYADRPGAL